MLILERARLTRPWSIVAFAAHTPFYLPHHHGISMAKRNRYKSTRASKLSRTSSRSSQKTTKDEQDTPKIPRKANVSYSKSKKQEKSALEDVQLPDISPVSAENSGLMTAVSIDKDATSSDSRSRQTTFLYGEEAKKARLVRFEQYEKERDISYRFGRLHDTDTAVEPVKPLRNMHVAKLEHGLDRVLFNPGVHWLRDQRTGTFNYTPEIQRVLDVDLFDYTTLPPYVTSSRDKELLYITKRQKKKYCGSTSSLTGLLSHCYFLLSRWKEPNLTGFSPSFQNLLTGFSEGSKMPVSIMLRYQTDGFYAIDADKNSDGEMDNTNYLLTTLGKSLEKFLTSSPDEYAQHKRVNSWKLGAEVREQQEAYHYAQSPKFLLRSQLDCYDERLPKRTFDLKTRAVVSIRNDRANYAEGCGYQIRFARGLWESFEREYWDMVRAAFLKYNFQARIGHMDGIFVAYHNTSEIFGFQYIDLEEMNLRLFGSNEMGDKAYHMSIGLLERILDVATENFPNETLSITMETRPGTGNMYVIVESTETSRILQLDVVLDRYLNNALVRGPVDFVQFCGPMTEAELEDMHCGRSKSKLSDVQWYVDYCITPRHDFPEKKTRQNLQEIRNRQRLMRTMTMPNVEMLDEREKERLYVLSKQPGALERFLHERENGQAIGMPLAPGQKTTRELIQREGLLNIESQGHSQPTTAVKWLRYLDPMTKRVRELSREGHRRLKQQLSK